MDTKEEEQPPVEIPLQSLSPQALHGVIESFILRDGTDYGVVEASFENKEQQIRRQIETGHVKIVFDPNTESVGLMTLVEWQRRS